MNNMKNESQKKEKDLNKKTDQKSPQILKDQEKKKASEYKSFKVVEDLKIKLKEVESLDGTKRGAGGFGSTGIN